MTRFTNSWQQFPLSEEGKTRQNYNMKHSNLLIWSNRKAESKSDLYFGPFFVPLRVWFTLLSKLLAAFYKMPSFWVKLGSLTFQNVHSRLKYVVWPLSLTFSMFSTNCWGSQDIVMEPTWLVNWNRVLASSLKGIKFGCNINFVRPVSYLSTLPLSSWGLLHNWVVVNSK